MKLGINSRWLNGDRAWITVRSNGAENTLHVLGLRHADAAASHRRISGSLEALSSPPDGYFRLRATGQTKHDPGAHLDLPFVVGVLAAARRISRHVLSRWEFFGQLHRGELQANKQDFSQVVHTAVDLGQRCILPAGDLVHLPAELAEHCVGAQDITDVVTHLRGFEPVLIPCRPTVRLEHRLQSG